VLPGKQITSQTEDRLLVRALRGLNFCYTHVYHELIVRRTCRLPAKGPAILVCNHTSALDPLLIQSVCRRPVLWMMAAEYSHLPGLSWFFDVMTIPTVRRRHDLAAARRALEALEQGTVLGVFPEGKIETTRDLLPFQTGVAQMAIRAGVSVYPACLDGTQRNKGMLQVFLLPCRATLAFGAPVRIERGEMSRSAVLTATARIQAAVEALIERRL
jgi:1-acyl-sn-glycerol-3-phosphate acyltransferase